MGRSTRKHTDTATPAAPVVDSTDTEPTEPTPAPVDTEPTDSTDTEPSTDTPAADPRDALALSWRAATDAADVTTGVIPSGPLSAVVTAYRAVPSAQRKPAVLALSSADTERAMDSGPLALATEPWRGVLLAASSGLTEHLRSLSSAPAAPVVNPMDSLHALAVGALSVAVTIGEPTINPDHLGALSMVVADLLGVTEQEAHDLATWAGQDSADGDPAGIVRARAAVRSSRGKGSARKASSGGTGGARVSGAAKRDDGTAYTVADHIAQALAVLGSPAKDSAIVKQVTDAYPDTDTRPSPGAVSGVSVKAASAAGIVRSTVDGKGGWALA